MNTHEPENYETSTKVPNRKVGATKLSAIRGHMVAGERYELYSNYALQIQAVAASVTAKQGRAEGEIGTAGDCAYEHPS